MMGNDKQNEEGRSIDLLAMILDMKRELKNMKQEREGDRDPEGRERNDEKEVGTQPYANNPRRLKKQRTL